MATEADIVEAMSHTKREVEAVTYLTAAVQLETTKDMINSTFGTSEGGNFLEPFSAHKVAPKVANEEVSSFEYYEADEPIQSEKEKSENEKQLGKGEQLETLEETRKEGNEQTEENTTTAEQDNRSHDIEEVRETSQEMAKIGEPGLKIEIEESTENKIAEEQHTEVISNQQASIGKSQPSIEKGIKGLEEDEKQEIVEDKSTSLSGKEVLNVDNISSVDAIEIEEERSFTGVLIKEAEKSFDLVEEKVPEAIGSSKETETEKDDKEKIKDNSIANDSIPNIAASQEIRNDEEETSKSGDAETDKLEKASITGLSVQEAGIEEEEKHDEAPVAPGKVIIQDEIESNEQEKDGAPEILNIAEASTLDVTNQNDFLEKASLAGVTSSGNVNNDEISEQKFDASSIIHEEGIQQKDEGLDLTEAAVEEVRDVEESTVVVAEDITTSKLILAEDHKEQESTEHDGRIEPSLLQQNEPENKKPELNVIAGQQETAASKDDSTTTTYVKEESNGAESTGKDSKEAQVDENEAGKPKEEESSTKINKEGNVNELPPEYIQQDSTATLKVDGDEGEESKEEILEESETVGAGESISSEHVERCVDVSLVKQEEVMEEEAEDLVPIKASIEDNKVDTFSAELPKDDGHDIVEDTEKTVKVESKGEEDSEKALQKDEPEEAPDTEKKEEKTENLENTDSTRKEVIEISIAGQETEEQILEEFTNEGPSKETSKENKFAASETAPLSTNTGEHNSEEQTISELSSSLAGEKTVEDSSKGDENNAIGSKEKKEVKISEFKEQNVATDLTKEKEPEDSTEPNRDNYATTATKHLEEEILAEEGKENFDQNSAVVSETNEKLIEEEIQDKGVTINTSDSVPDRIVSEEIGLKEAELDNKDQIKNSDIALEEKELTSNVDSEVKQEQKSSAEESGEEIPATASETVEQTEEGTEEIEDKTPTEKIGNEEKIAITETVLDDIPEDNLHGPSVVPSIDNEAKTNEASHVSEETPEKDESIKPSDVPILESDDIVRETKNEEVQKQSDEELHISSEQIYEIASSESVDVGTLKTEEATDFANKNEVSDLVILTDEKLSSEVDTSNAVDTRIDSEKAIQEYKEPENKFEDSLKSEVNTAVECEANANRNDDLSTKEALETTNEGQETGETDSIKDYSPEFAEEEQLEGSTNEDKVLETTVAGQESEEFANERPTEENSKEHKEFTALETAPLSTKTGDHNLEEQTTSELSSSLAGEKTVEDSSKGDENNAIDSKEEKADKNFEFKEQDVATDLTEEKEPEDSKEPNKDSYATTSTEHLEEEILAEESKETFVQNSSVKAETNEKVIEEEIQDKGVTINDSDSVPDRIVSEDIGLKEAEPDNKDQVISVIAPEGKESTSNVDSEVQQEQKSSTEENAEEIPALASESVEQIEDKSPTSRIENEEKRANSDIIIDDDPEDSLQESSTVPSIKNEALTAEASDISEETSAKDEIHHESAKTPSVEPKEEELQLINKAESVKSDDVSKLETYDIVKETESEEVQKQSDQELHISSEQINEVSSSEIFKDEKLSSEVSTRNVADTCMESEKAIQECKEPDNNSEGSLKSEVNTATELEANTNPNDELPTKEALETTNGGQETRETDSIKDNSPEFANEVQLEKSTNDDKVIVGVDTTPASTTIGKQHLEEQDISEIASSLLQEETAKEIFKEDKDAVTNSEQERKVTDLDSKEQLEVTDLRGETKHETLEENIETNKDLYVSGTEEAPEKEMYAEESNEVLGQDSSSVSDVSKKVIEEESEEKEPAEHNSKSVSDGIVSDQSGATFDVKPEESSSSEETREEILIAANDHGNKIEDKVEESIDTRTEEEEKITTNEMSAGTVSDELGLMKGGQEDEEQVKSFTIAPEENGSASSATYDVKPEENSSKEEKREEILKEANDNGEKIEGKVEESIDTQPEEEEKTTSNETSAGTVNEEAGLKHGKPEDEEQVKSYTIAPEDGEKIEDKVEESIRTQTEEEEKITSTETPAGTVSEETGLKKGEPEDEEQVKSYTIAPVEKDSASSATFDAKPDEHSGTEENREEILTEANDHGEKIEDKVEESIDAQTEEEEKITSNETSAATVSEETTLKHGEPEDKEQVKSYTIAPEEKREEILTEANDHVEKIEDKVEESIDTQTEEEEKITSTESSARTVSEETLLKHSEPEDKEQVKSYTIAPEEKDSASSTTFDVKPEENSSTEEKREEILTEAKDHGEKNEDKVEESIDTQTEEEEKITSNETSAGTVSEETTLKHGEPVDEEQVKSYTIAPEEKDSASSTAVDANPEESSSIEENREEILAASNGHGEKIEAKVEETIDTETEEEEKIISNETSTGSVSEETWLKKGEPEDKGQVKSYTIAPDDSASSATFDVKPQENSSTKLSGEEILTKSYDGGEEIEEKVEENTDAGTVEKKITTNETSSHDIPGDDLLTSEAIERSDEVTNVAEERKLEILEDSAGPNKESYATIATEALEGEKLSEESNSTFVQNSSSVVEVSEKGNEDVIEEKAPIKSSSSSDSTAIPIEETGLKVAEPEKNEPVRNSEIESKEEKGLATCAEIEIKQEENSNTEENGEKEISAIAESGGKIGHALDETRETDSVEDHSPESSNKEQPEENTQEDKVLVGIETTPSSTNTGKQELGEQEMSEISSSLIGGEKPEEILKDDKNALMKLERKDTELDFKKQLGVTLEKKEESYEDLDTTRTIEATEAETHAEEPNTILVEYSSFVSEVTKPEKEIGEEIKEVEPAVYNSNSVSAGTVSEEIDLKKGKPEERDQVKSYTIEPEEKGSAPEDSSSTKDNMEEILTAANDHGEKIEEKVEDSSGTQTEEKKITTSETSLHDKPEAEADLLTTEAVESLDETAAGDKVSDLAEETKHETLEDSAGSNKEIYATITPEALEGEKIAEESNKTLVQNSTIVAEASEKVIEENFQDKETVSTGIVTEETDLKEGEPENMEHIQNSDIAPEEKILVSNVDIGMPQEKKSILEEDGEKEIPVVACESGEKIGHADKNFEASISDAEVVKTATELKAENTETDEIQKEAIPVVACESGEKIGDADENFEASIADAEVVKRTTESKAENTENNEIQREENLESVYPGQVLVYTSESATQDEIEETHSLTKDIQTEPVPIEQQEVALHGESEMKVETEPRLTVEDESSEIESTNETIKAVILTEVTEEIEKADKSDNIEERVIDRESNLTELHPASVGEEKESGLVLGENLKEPDFNETTPPIDSQAEEDTSKKGESPVTEAPEKEKIQDKGIDPVDVCVAVAEEGKYEEEIKCDSATVTEATALTNLADAQVVNETVNTFDTASEENVLKYEPSVTRDGSLNLEKSSSNLVSQRLDLDHRDTERENVTGGNSDEVQETTKASEVENTDETRPIPAVEKLEWDEIEEEIKESSNIVSTSEIVNDQALSAGISEAQLQVQSSTFFAEEKEHETKTTTKELEKESTKEVDKQGDDNIEESSVTQKEEHEEIKVSELDVEKLVANETEEDIKNAPEKESKNEVEKQDDEIIEDFGTHLQQEEQEELQVSEFPVEKLVTNEIEEDIKNAPKKESTKEVERQDDERIEDSSATRSQQEEHKELKVSELDVEKQITNETEEDIKNAPDKESTKEVEKQDNKNIEDSSATNLQQEEHKELKVSELDLEKLVTDETEEDIENALEKESTNEVEKQDDECIEDSGTHLQQEEYKEPKVSELTVEKPVTDEIEEDIKNAPEKEGTKEVEKQNDESIEDSYATHLQQEEHKELKVSEFAVEKPGTNETEEDIKHAPETVSQSHSQSVEAVSKDEIITDQILPVEITSEQFQASSSTFLLKEQEQGTIPTFKTIDGENKKEVETLDSDSSKVFDVTKTSEEAITQKEVTKELKLSEGVAEISGVAKTEEEIKEASETLPKFNSEEFEEVTKKKIITEQTLPEEISKEQLLVSSSTLLPREQEDETATTTQKVDEENKKEVEILGNEKIVEKEEPRELKVSEPTVQTLGEDEIEEKEYETVSEHSSSTVEVLAGDEDIAQQVLPVDKDEVIIDQALPAGLSSEQLQLPVSTLLPKELEHDSATTVKKTEEETRVVCSPLQSEKITDIIGEITETTNLDIGSSEIPSNFVSEKAQNDGLFTKTEDIEVDESHLKVAKTDSRTEESQSELIIEANNDIKNEISDEKIKEDKEATNGSQPVSLGEENVQESHQEVDSETKEHPGDKTDGPFKAATNENKHKELSEADEKEETNGNTEKLITSEEATSVKDHEPLSIEDRTIEENSPAETKEKNVKDEVLNFDTENQKDEVNFENRTTEFTSTREKETVEIPREESGLGLTEAEKITSDIKQLQKSSHATLEMQTPREEDLDRSSTATTFITAEKDVPLPPTVPDPIKETTHRTELKKTEPQNDTSVDTEIKVVERGIEEEKGESGGRTTETVSSAGKLSLSELLQSTTKVTKRDVIEEKEAKSSKEAEGEEEHQGEAQKDDEEGEEHKGSSEPESDAPVIVEASRDIDVKVAHKKSHSILSGVGSKVKHSISKVKKAITGKSSHSKQGAKKPDDPSS
ncbi:uncharacterized protein LOC107415461 isoform X2 [Ziziphus jujuba]|uniref:Uncharacterized protein LOC107415461 isoform X2 n=1 Tax=Ziziphus jujuba TaxID=326968 RepID=A0ABM3IFV8_ZIZJJ|nr:uncharacterized protein LOC107415461 isoform X2 [Ziziphus jujuba]